MNNSPPTEEDLDSNYGIVYSRFKEVMKSLDKQPDKLQQYKENHEKEAALDFIEEVPLDELNNRNIFKHYINHFPVFRQDSATSKCRRVFDASLHKKGKACLNDRMLKGSQMTPHILNVLLRIRLLRNLFTLDISKAFLRMVLKIVIGMSPVSLCAGTCMTPIAQLSFGGSKVYCLERHRPRLC